MYFCAQFIFMSNKIRVLFIVNPISGTGNKEHILKAIPDYLKPERFQYQICRTDHRGHAAEIAQQAVADGVDVVVAVGGDGTVNEVARCLVHTNSALGIIPCGSGNGLARHLNIPISPSGALRILSACQIESLDYGLINDTPFFCTCGVGFDAFVSSCFAKSGKRGLLSYIENTLKEGLTYKPDVYEMEIDGKKEVYKAFLIACANASQYGNNVFIAPHASMSDGLMDVTIMEPFSMLEAPQIAIQLFNKNITKNSHIRSFKCSNLRIRRSSPGVIHFDGDPQDAGRDIDVRLIPGAIRMVVGTEQRAYESPLLSTFWDIQHNMNAEISSLKRDIQNGRRRIRAINQELLGKLKRPR